MNGGFIKIGRDIFEEPLLVDPVCFRAWVWLLAEAAWKPRRITVMTGRSKVAIELERGQLSYSLSYMATAWNVGIQRVRTILRLFEASDTILIKTGRLVDTQPNTQSTRKPGTQTNTRTGQLPMLVTICNHRIFVSVKMRKTYLPTHKPTRIRNPKLTRNIETKN
jgi:hypothetical protein